MVSVKLEGGLSEGLTPDKVVSAVEMLISAYDPVGLVYGAGFEHQPELIAAIAGRTRIFGNDAATLMRAKDPLGLARVCEAGGVRHPAIALEVPDEPGLWLMKRRGGAGGAHVATAEDASCASPECYFQRRVSGKSISALFLASNRKAEIIGLSMQWTAPTRRYALPLRRRRRTRRDSPAQAEEIARGVAAIAHGTRSRGPRQRRFSRRRTRRSGFWRSTRGRARRWTCLNRTTIHCWRAISTHAKDVSRPCRRRLAFEAAEIVYAPCDAASAERRNWPDWAADRSAAGNSYRCWRRSARCSPPARRVDLARAQRERAGAEDHRSGSGGKPLSDARDPKRQSNAPPKWAAGCGGSRAVGDRR